MNPFPEKYIGHISQELSYEKLIAPYLTHSTIAVEGDQGLYRVYTYALEPPEYPKPSGYYNYSQFPSPFINITYEPAMK